MTSARFATIRLGREGATRAVADFDSDILPLLASDIREILSQIAQGTTWDELIDAGASPLEREALDFAPLVPRPGKIVCVGQNYRAHILELGNTEPEFPTLFAKFSTALIGARDEITLPRPEESETVDWEAELAIVIGSGGRRLDALGAAAAIAGFTVSNDVSVRNWQRKTAQWLQGKTWDQSTPLGPWLVSTEELGVAPDLAIRTLVDGELRQDSRTADMLFSPTEIVSYVSTVMTLEPGDILLTGTPSGVGAGMTPPTFLRAGQLLETEIEGVGRLANRVR